MIFLTTGTQLPFDRMVGLVDDYCAAHPGIEVFGQIGEGQYRPRHFAHRDFLGRGDSHRLFEKAEVIIAHAGIGSILTALGMGKPILVMARRMVHGEHRNDHQLGTIERFAAFPHCFPFETADQLDAALAEAMALNREAATQSSTLSRYAPENMLQEVRRLLA